MRLLADENFPGSAVQALIGAGHDVVWIRTAAPGMSDEEIFKWAVQDGRVILTFDKDFGDIARNARVSGSCGVILFRMVLPAHKAAAILVQTIAARSDWPGPDWPGHFSVIEAGRVRMKRMSDLSP